jgi:hypothetical protein
MTRMSHKVPTIILDSTRPGLMGIRVEGFGNVAAETWLDKADAEALALDIAATTRQGFMRAPDGTDGITSAYENQYTDPYNLTSPDGGHNER